MNNILLLVLLFAQTAAAEAPAAPKGRVCVGDKKSTLTEGKCSNTSGLAFDVEPSEQERLFVWTSADSATAHLGIVPAKATRVALDRAAASTIELTLDGDSARGWPADVTATLAEKQRWSWVLDATAATRLRRIVVPRGRYALQLKADRHRVYRGPGITATQPTVSLGNVKLVPLPAARGVLVDTVGKPVTDAAILRPDGSVCATPNEQGAFVCELGDPPPEALVVTSAGRGPRDLPLSPQASADIDLGRITLPVGRELALTIVRPDAGAGRVTLLHDTERYKHSTLGSVELREREEVVRFDVGAGKYVVVVEGSGPLERLEKPIEVKEEDLAETITVTPYQLIGTATFGGDPLQEGRVSISADQHGWRAEVPLRAGAFGGTMWQVGSKVRAFINSKELGVAEMVESPELGADPTRWDVRIEKRMIVGRVLDAESKTPASNIDFSLTAQFDDAKFYTSVTPEPDGAFRILAKPGTYSLRVTSPEHAAYSVDIPITAADRVKTHDILLERGVVQRLDIVTPTGAPLPGATILEGVQPDGVNPRFILRADAAGQYALRGKPGETRVLYVTPRSGSIAVVRVVMPKGEAKPLQVVVPPVAGSLRVRTVDARNELVGAGLLLRWNGEFLPNAILRFATHNPPTTHPDGEGVVARLPAGMYEVWALSAHDAEAQLIASGGTLRPPVRVGLAAGEQSVTVIAPPREAAAPRKR